MRLVELEADLADLYARSPESGLEMSAIARVFRQLPEDDRELLALVAWEGLDAGQISRVLDCSRNAVRIRLYRARKRFSKALALAGVTAANHLAVEST